MSLNDSEVEEFPSKVLVIYPILNCTHLSIL